MILSCLPHGGTLYAETANAYFTGASQRDYKTMMVGGVWTLGNYNTCWARAREMRVAAGIKYWAMLHSDVVPSQWYLDTLINELDEHDADIMTTVLPIKDWRGLTSTALDTDSWNPRRLTMTEVLEQLPETFGDDTEFDGKTIRDHGGLLVNLGCWVCRFDRPWVDLISFRWGGDRIGNGPEGDRAEFQPEDWTFARDARALGCKIMATRKVKATHIGFAGYDNHRVWGSERTDSAGVAQQGFTR